MFRLELLLERQIEDKNKSGAQEPTINELKRWRLRWEDSFAADQLIRSHYRERRKRIEQAKANDRKLLAKTSLRIKLVKSSSSDKTEAKALLRSGPSSSTTIEESEKQALLKSSIIVPKIRKTRK